MAALVSFALAHLIVTGIHAAGGFYLPGPKNGLGFALISAMPAQMWATVYNILILFGAGFIGVALEFGALRMGLRGFFTRMDRVNQTLVAGTVFILMAGAFGLYADPVTGAHDIIPVLPFCAVLAGRPFGERLARRLAGGPPPPSNTNPVPCLVPVLPRHQGQQSLTAGNGATGPLAAGQPFRLHRCRLGRVLAASCSKSAACSGSPASRRTAAASRQHTAARSGRRSPA
jgi:hypothetical protein